ncbi:MAG: hypothetical protein EPN25_03775 [Nitrospirae bacterium]|nr:MAG: hypothetical protein EPN25_03775 [Nitrospirota bacterium]
MKMNIEKENRFFKLTRAGIEDYKKNDPLEKARNPRQSYFAGQWDVNWAFGNWIITVIFLIGSLAIDLFLFPFQVLSIIFENDKKRMNAK